MYLPITCSCHDKKSNQSEVSNCRERCETSQTKQGAQCNQTDLQTTQEEAGVIIIHWVIQLARNDTKSIEVTCDDTDAFILLMHAFVTYKHPCLVVMEGTSSSKKLLDVGASAAHHSSIVAKLPAAHAINGCDTVAQCFEIGKARAIN